MKIIYSFLAIVFWLSVTNAKGQNIPSTFIAPPPINNYGPPNSYTYSASNTLNFKRTWQPLVPTTNSGSDMFTLHPTTISSQYCSMGTTYTNGFGQTIESIKRGALTNGGKDVISLNDNKPSLTHNGYLPFSTTPAHQFDMDGFSDSYYYYNWYYYNEQGNCASQTSFSNDNQIPTTTSYAPGVSFLGQNVGTVVTTKLADPTDPMQNIPVFSYTTSLTQNGYYTTPLTVKNTVSPNGGKMYEFYDLDNKLLCKKIYQPIPQTLPNNVVVYMDAYLTTYYVYDDIGRLRLIIPPSEANDPNPDNASSYHFTYDANGNIVSKSVPGQLGIQTVVYDSLQRPILMQTPLMAKQGKSRFKLYDDQNRVVIEGFFWDNHYFPFTALQDWIRYPATASTTGSYTLFNYFINGISGANITSIPNCEIDVINYYDQLPSSDPAFLGAAFNNSFSSDYLPTINGVVTPVASGITKGLLVGSKVLVRDSSFSNIANKWITSTYFYDQQGQLIQAQTLNPWNTTAKDVMTFQYNFTHQKVLEIVNYNDHSTSNKPSTKLVKQYAYDKNNDGRLLSTTLSPDNTGFRTLNTFTYDDLGRIQSKTMGGVESQVYDYNIRGQLTGINSNYALTGNNPNGNINFGCSLNYDQGFSMPRLDGKISGMIWRGAGTLTPERAYGYEYDNAGRLTAGDYNEIDFVTGGGYTAWANTLRDYSMTNVTYDQNGNIQTMKQMGTPGGAAPMQIDQLSYTYSGNQLQNVTDAVTANFNLGDFTNGPACGNCHYAYDEDGNLSFDPGKQLSAAYNELGQPVAVNFANGANIRYIYTGQGALVRKITTDQSANHHEYRYWGPFVYEDDQLQFVLHEEGRARYLADTLAFRFDYFVKDHLGNVRSVVTADERPKNSYLATYELISAQAENLIFNSIDNVRADNPLPVEDNTKAMLLNGSSNTIGTSILLHTMAGDKFDVQAQSYWQQDNSTGAQYYDDAGTLANALVSTLASGTPGPSFSESITTTFSGAINSSLAANLDAYQSIMNTATTPGVPRAYINYMVFDEGMNFISDQSGAVQIGATDGSWQPIGTTQPVQAAQNGYVLIFLSNAQTQDVHFDNMNVTVYSGRLLQEQDYYPYGLPINEGQNSTTLTNKYLYQGKEMNTELGLSWADFKARQYDPQLGKFCSADPASQYTSPYIGMGDDPANIVDPTGAYGVSSNGGNINSYSSGSAGSIQNGDGSEYVNPISADGSGSNIVGIQWTKDGMNTFAGEVVPAFGGGYTIGNVWANNTIGTKYNTAGQFGTYTQEAHYMKDEFSSLFVAGIGNASSVVVDKFHAIDLSSLRANLGGTHTTKVGSEFGGSSDLGDKFRLAIFKAKTTGTEKRININSTTFINQRNQQSTSNNLSLNFDVLKYNLTGTQGFEQEINIGPFNFASGANLTEGFTISESINGYGVEGSVKPGGYIYGAAVILGSYFGIPLPEPAPVLAP